jgi:hypothetical protein
MPKREIEMRLRIVSCVLPSLFLAIMICSFARADEPPKSPQRSTDDMLRDTLNSQSGDDYDRALLGKSGKADSAAKDRKTGDSDKLLDQLGPAAQRADQQEDQLLQAVKGMRDVQTRLAQGKSDAITQQVQRQVVADLQKIIDTAKKSGKCLGQSMACNCNKPGRPSASPNPQPRPSTANDRPARESDPNVKHEPKPVDSTRRKVAVQAMNKLNIELQTRQRETMLELPSDYFMPEYEREIEDYFGRMSSDKPTEEKP